MVNGCVPEKRLAECGSGRRRTFHGEEKSLMESVKKESDNP